MAEYIYLIQEREFIKCDEPIFKIGRTTQLPGGRMGGYPKDSVLLIMYICSDSVTLENKLKQKFNKKFELRSDIGAEYFEGNSREMISIIIKECDKDFTHVDYITQVEPEEDEGIKLCTTAYELFAKYNFRIVCVDDVCYVQKSNSNFIILDNGDITEAIINLTNNKDMECIEQIIAEILSVERYSFIRKLERYELLFYINEKKDIGLFDFRNRTMIPLGQVPEVIRDIPLCKHIVSLSIDYKFMTEFMNSFVKDPSLIIEFRGYMYMQLIHKRRGSFVQKTNGYITLYSLFTYMIKYFGIEEIGRNEAADQADYKKYYNAPKAIKYINKNGYTISCISELANDHKFMNSLLNWCIQPNQALDELALQWDEEWNKYHKKYHKKALIKLNL